MNSLEEIRERDTDSAETWFRTPALGACGRAFIDRRWLLAEVDRLSALLTQAPIAKVTVREGCAHYAPDDVSVSLYAPGLPPGEYDLYLMPSVPQSAEHK